MLKTMMMLLLPESSQVSGGTETVISAGCENSITGIGMGNTCISKADSCQCMTKTTTIL